MKIKLLNDILNELVDSEKSVSGPLLKTKVLAMQIQNDELLNWVNGELDGYSENSELPKYRTVYGILKANYINGHWKFQNQSLNISMLPQSAYDSILLIKTVDSIKSLETLAERYDKAPSISLSAEKIDYIQACLRKENPMLSILSAHVILSLTYIPNIIEKVRSKLLEFIITIQNEFGVEPEIDNLKANESKIIHIMNTTITNNGDGINVNVGQKNSITATTNISKGNKEVLKETLLKNNLPTADVDALLEIIDTEEPIGPNQYGAKVSKWFNDVFAKIGEGSWQIAIGTAGGMLAEVLNKYYGIG